MARLFEYQGKMILRDRGISVPPGVIVTEPGDLDSLPSALRLPVVVKQQTWRTGRRSAAGGVARCNTWPEVSAFVDPLFGSQVRLWGPTPLALVEEYVSVAQEVYAAISIDEEVGSPLIMFSPQGGSEIELGVKTGAVQIYSQHVNILRGILPHNIMSLVKRGGFSGPQARSLTQAIHGIWRAYSELEARTIEVNPLGVATDGSVVALDCKITLDDSALFRHPEIEVHFGREFDRPPTFLERLALNADQADHRGTFFFYQIRPDPESLLAEDGWIGFHGAGGGGAMMSADALVRAGLRPANFCDTSGNPPAAKVYRAARIVLSQPGIEAFFYSGAGMASQDMPTIAEGLVRALIDDQVTIPIVLRLGGNGQDAAIELFNRWRRYIPAPAAEAHGADMHLEESIARLIELMKSNRNSPGLKRRAWSLPVDFPLTPASWQPEGLEEYRGRLTDLPSVQRIREVPYKWAF